VPRPRRTSPRPLDAIPLTSIDTADSLLALAVSVDSARYWQEPDGADELLLASGLEGALERIAAHVVASPSTSWWSNPMEEEQWTLRFRDSCFETPTPPSAGEALRVWHERAVEGEQKASRERPTDPAANFSGEWWSKLPSALPTSTRSLPDLGPAGLWLIEDRCDQEPADVHLVTFHDATGHRSLAISTQCTFPSPPMCPQREDPSRSAKTLRALSPDGTPTKPPG